MIFPQLLLDIFQKWLESTPVIVTLVFSAIQLRDMKETEKVANQLTIVSHHREIWSRMFDRPELARILQSNVDLKTKPITNQESLFITFLILHLRAVLRAVKAGMFVPAEQLSRDVAWIFSLPIPREVWRRSRAFQDEELVTFIENALKGDCP